MLNGMQHPVIRQQENWMLSVRPDVLERASLKLLQRMGFQATNAAQTNEGHGFGASGRIDELAGATVDFLIRCGRRQLSSRWRTEPKLQCRPTQRPLYSTRGRRQGPSGRTQAPVSAAKRLTLRLGRGHRDRAISIACVSKVKCKKPKRPTTTTAPPPVGD